MILDLINFVLAIITDEEYFNISKVPTESELHSILLSILENSSVGLDGFSLNFCVVHWDFNKDNLMEATSKFLNGASLPKTTLHHKGYTTSFKYIPKSSETKLGFYTFCESL